MLRMAHVVRGPRDPESSPEGQAKLHLRELTLPEARSSGIGAFTRRIGFAADVPPVSEGFYVVKLRAGDAWQRNATFNVGEKGPVSARLATGSAPAPQTGTSAPPRDSSRTDAKDEVAEG